MVTIFYKMSNPSFLTRVRRLQSVRIKPPIRSYHVNNNTNITLYIKMICSPYLCSPRETNAKSGCRVLFVIFPKYSFVYRSFVIPLIYYLSSFKYNITRALYSYLESREQEDNNIILCDFYLFIFINIIVFFLSVNMPIKTISCNKMKEKYKFYFRLILWDERAAVYNNMYT